MIFIYNLAIQMYAFGIRVAAALGNPKAKLWVEGRKNWRSKIPESLKPDESRVWFHCSSLGEFEQGRPVIEEFKMRNEKLKIVLTFFSPSGFEIRKNYSGADYVFYLPADTKANSKDFIELIKPEKVFFTKYEYWHHYFHQLKKKNIPLYMVSAVFRPDDRFFKSYGSFFRNILQCVSHFFVQNEESKSLLMKIGFNNSSVAGDTRFDRVVEVSRNAKEIPVAEKFSRGKIVLVAGSTWSEDEKILADTIKSFSCEWKLIIAPHEINKSRISEVIHTFLNFNLIQFSKASNEELSSYDVLLIDNIGMLSSLYCYGQYAYVGGGFGKGIHNTLEAAVFGIPVFFGPSFEKFNEAKELINCGGGFLISSGEKLKNELRKFFENSSYKIKAGAAAKNYVTANAGATEIILNYVK